MGIYHVISCSILFLLRARCWTFLSGLTCVEEDGCSAWIDCTATSFGALLGLHLRQCGLLRQYWVFFYLFIFFNGFGLARVGIDIPPPARLNKVTLEGVRGGSIGFWDLGVNGNGVFWLVGSSFYTTLYTRGMGFMDHTRVTQNNISSRRRRKYLRGPQGHRTEGPLYYNPIERYHVSFTYLTKFKHMINVT